LGFECISRTHVGLKRKVNEDSVMLRTDHGLWAVADGMGGHEAGDVASRKVAEALARLPDGRDVDDLTDSAVSALEDVNAELIRLARADHRPRTIGSTVVGLAIRDGQYRCFWAGDSRAYRIRGNRIERITRDHSLVQGLIDAGMLSREEARDHPDANVITRAVGASESLEVEIAAGDAEPGDQFLLASDGLTRLVDDDELATILSSWPPGDAADTLIDAVLARGAPDNVSLIIARVH
jgi:serine/threonine-protein phosphatase Stp1